MNISESFDMLPNDDIRSYAFRLVHLALIGGIVGAALIAVLLALIIYLVFSVRAVMAKLGAIEAKLKRIEARVARAEHDPLPPN